ncbi:MAG: zinc-binding alcohol dehydrogenase family protein [Planctomycetes bacterium]|nr:zinc-binding alcohol dehydrogenase family protein [Planctomycetota bacterium]
MKTIILDEPGRFRMAETAAPASPGAGEALVRVKRIGVCGTDLHAFRGRQPFFTYPRILGHELGVEVTAVGAGVTAVKVGDRCAVEPYLNCGICIACRRGRPNCCVKMNVIGVHSDGGMRESILVPAAKLHRSDRLEADQLALVETLGIGAHAVERGAPERGEWALVIGAGPIGLSVIQFAIQAGARVVVMDTNEQRLAFCRSVFRAEETLVPGVDAVERVRAICDGDGPTLVFDATGHRESMNRSFDFVAAGGRLVFVGLMMDDITFRDPEFHRREMTLLATRNSTPDTFRRVIRLMEEGAIDTRPWITHRVKFGGMIGEFPKWLDPASGCVKAVVEI